jgi:hypothetical protein
MARRSLRPELNRIRAWARQGRTDAWIAHQLDVTVQQIAAFKREHRLDDASEPDGAAVTSLDYDDEIDLRAEDDALIAAELEEAEARRAEEEARKAEEEARKAEEKARRAEERAAKRAAEKAAAEDDSDGDDEDSDDGAEPRSGRRRRGRRGGRRRRRGPLEATFEHGEEGYGLWLDPAVADDPVYAEYWAGHRPVEVTIEEDQIVIRRAGEEESDDDD